MNVKEFTRAVAAILDQVRVERKFARDNDAVIWSQVEDWLEHAFEGDYFIAFPERPEKGWDE